MGKKLFFALLKGISVSGTIAVALLCESVTSTPKPSETGFLLTRSNDRKPGFLPDQNTIIAQNSSNSEADRLLQEGLQLFQQGTAESLRAALEKWEAARQLYRAAGDKGKEALTLVGMGRINDLLGEKQKALDYYNQALPLRRAVGDRGGEATTLNNIGRVYDSLGEKQKALDYYNQALPLLRAVGDRGVEAVTLSNFASLKRSQGNLTAAPTDIEAAIKIIEDLRTKIGSQELRQSYFASYAALKYPEPLNLQQIQQQILDDDTLLLQYSLGEERSYLWAVTKNSITSYVLPKQSEIEAAVETFRESVTKDSSATLDTGLPLSQILLAPVANLLGNKRLLIVGDGALQYVPFAALPSPSSPTNPLLVQNEIVTLPSISTVAIQRRQLQNRSPVAKTVAIIADPIFNLEDDRIPGNPPAQNPDTLSDLSLNRATRNLGLGQDGGGKIFDRLAYTRAEADKILALVPEAQRFQAFDFNASRQTATNPDLAQYQIIHFATHGLVDPIAPELSGVVLSLYDQKGNPSDGFLRLHDIFNLNLPAELVVLSACETGLGKDVKGEGLVGLTRSFMYAGARRVVVSLWSVNDAATSELMAKFYQKMLQGGQNPITALRAAQLEMWNSSNRKSPYYWAAFTVQGDWR